MGSAVIIHRCCSQFVRLQNEGPLRLFCRGYNSNYAICNTVIARPPPPPRVSRASAECRGPRRRRDFAARGSSNARTCCAAEAWRASSS